MFKAFLIGLEMILLIIVSIILIPITYIISYFSPNIAQSISQNIALFFGWLSLKICGAKIDIIGEENIPDEPCLYIANHRSYFDTVLCILIMKKKSFFIAKDGVGKIPILNFWMLHMKCLLLDREDIKQALGVILKAIEQIKSGYSCFIFPEGTRTKGDVCDMLPFKQGSLKPAVKTGCPICPITLINTRDLFERQAPRFKKAHCKIIIDKPIYISKLSDEDKLNSAKYVQNIILENIKKYK